MDIQDPTRNNRELIDTLKRLPLQDVPAGMTDRIMSRITKSQPGIISRIFRQINGPLTLSFRPVYAFCLALLVAGAFLLGRMSQDVQFLSPDVGTSSLISEVKTTGDAHSAYLAGRELLAADNGAQALPLLRKAALTEPGNPEYAYWEGVGYWAIGDWQQERRSYLRGLASAPESVPLLINLGHSYLGEKNYEQALEAYQAVLSLSPGEAVAQYNSGLIYRNLHLVQEEIGAWKAYLRNNRTGKWAFRAVERLNEYGDFSYRTYRIGIRKMIFSPEVLFDDSLPEKNRKDELAPLVAILESNGHLNLEVVVFIEHDNEMARKKAHDIKRLILDSTEMNINRRVELSWFDKPEIITVQGSAGIELSEGLLLFSNLAPINGKEVSI